MDKKQLIKLCEEKSIIKINLKNGFFYSGQIKEVGDTSLVFLDKFNNEMIINLDSISYILPTTKDTWEDIKDGN